MISEDKNRALILIADDSLVVRSLLRRQLEESGHEVFEAVDGVDAVERTLELQPDVVLMDVEMPRLDGYGALAKLRTDPDLADIPVVILTTRSATEDVVQGLHLGAHDYLCKPFDPAELVARVSAAVRVKRLQDELKQRNLELQELSRMDVLTGMPNRRHLLEHLHAAESSARRHEEPFAVLMVDVDHFKNVNDAHGHENGDFVLRAVALALADSCRGEDVAGRWGGEEFLVVAPETGLAQAAVLAERIRGIVETSPVELVDGRSIPVTVSVGVAAGTADVDLLLRLADAALYEAKAAGRNRVVTSQ